MTGTEFFDILMQRLGNRQDADLRSALALELQTQVVFQEERKYPIPWFLMGTRTSFAVSAGLPLAYNSVSPNDPSYPNDIIGFDPDLTQVSYWDTANYGPSFDDMPDEAWISIPQVRPDRAKTYFVGTGAPKGWSPNGLNLRIWPTPDANYTLRFENAYFHIDPPGDVDGDRVWTWFNEAADVCLNALGRYAASYYLHNPQLADRFAADYLFARKRLDTETEFRMNGLRDVLMNSERV